LTARVDNLQAKLDQLIFQLEEEKIHRSNLQIQNSKLETRIDQQDEETRFLKNIMNNDDQLNKPKYLKNDASSDDLRNAGVKSDISPRLPPSSCRQLSTIGHYLDGIYLVANPDTNKIETVYCDFGSSTRKYIKYITFPVYFKIISKPLNSFRDFIWKLGSEE